MTMTQSFRIGTMIAALCLFSACAGTAVPQRQQPVPESAPTPSAAPTPSPAPAPGQTYRETGLSSWYGKELHGKKTAGGEVFDMYGMSAAHRTLPFGTFIRVTNLDNYKSVKVKVNDRGPFTRNRVLDLSLGAARELGFVSQGTARVKIETLDAVREQGLFTVQAGAFSEAENAKALKERLSKKFETVYIVIFESNLGKSYRVRVGSYGTEEKADAAANRLTHEGLEPVVLRKD